MHYYTWTWFFFLFGYPHIILKDEISPVRDSWLPLLINTLFRDWICVLKYSSDLTARPRFIDIHKLAIWIIVLRLIIINAIEHMGVKKV